MNPLSGLIAVLTGWWNWIKWFLERFHELIGKNITRFWGVVVLVASWVWVCLEYIWDKGQELIAFLQDGLPVDWPTWTNSVGVALSKANVWYPLEEHFECLIMLLALMAFLGALKIIRKILF